MYISERDPQPSLENTILDALYHAISVGDGDTALELLAVLDGLARGLNTDVPPAKDCGPSHPLH